MTAAEALLRSAPATQLTVCRFGIWNGALLIAGCVCFAIASGWLLASASQHSTWHRVAVMASAVLALVALLSEVRRSAVVLRWDGRSWYLKCGNCQSENPRVFAARVMLDLGNWMILKFSSARSAGLSSSVWVPVQRRGLETHWHALRCAVYSPRLDPAIPPHLDGLTRID